jgi:hypothetical protein
MGSMMSITTTVMTWIIGNALNMTIAKSIEVETATKATMKTVTRNGIFGLS